MIALVTPASRAQGDEPHRRVPARRRADLQEAVVVVALRLCALTSLVALLLLIVFVFREALPVLTNAETQQHASLHHFFSTSIWQPVGSVPKYGILPLLLGTLKTTVMAMLFGVPVALFAALFAAEFAPHWMREVLKPVIEMLAGVPSVVLGFFGLMVLASWVQAVTHSPMRLNAVSAGLALSLAVIPTVFSVAEDALRAVPRPIREASLALGATPWQTAWHVTLPAASAGALAGVLLGLARAVGETMIVLMVSGNASIVSLNPFDSVRTLSATIASEMAEVVVGSPHYSTLFFLGALLFTITFLINMAAGFFVGRLRARLTGQT